MVIEPKFDRIDKFFNGKAAVEYHRDWGYINKDGSWFIEPQYDKTKDFRENLGVVVDGRTQYYVNENKEIIGKENDYEVKHYFHDGLARVYRDRQWGYINIKGEVVIGIQFKHAKDFENDLAAVRKDGFWGFIDSRGNMVTQFEYDDTRDFMPIE